MQIYIIQIVYIEITHERSKTAKEGGFFFSFSAKEAYVCHSLIAQSRLRIND